MKKVLCIPLALMLMLGCVFAFSSCDTEEDTDENGGHLTVQAPSGYAVFENGEVGFAYPSDWSKTESSMVMLVDYSTGDNIVVAWENKNTLYDTVTAENFNSSIGSTLAASGITASDVDVTRVQTEKGVDIIKMSFISTTAAGISMQQTMCCFHLGNKTWSINLTNVSGTAEFETVFFNTLVAAD